MPECRHACTHRPYAQFSRKQLLTRSAYCSAAGLLSILGCKCT